MLKKIFVVLFVMIFALPCVAAKKRQSEEVITPLTQLEKRSFQTRTYNSEDKNIVMKSILNVLQDEGYIVYNVNSLLGFIYGVKDFDTTDKNIDISKEFGLSKSRLNYNGVTVATLEVSANITDYGKQLRARINFKRKLLNEYGNAQFIDDVNDGEFYEEFFSKLEREIQLQKQATSKVNEKIIPAVNIVKPKVELQPKKEEPVVELKQDKVQEQEQPQEQVIEPQTEAFAPENEQAKEGFILPEEEVTPQVEDEDSSLETKAELKEQQKAKKELLKQQAAEAKEQARREREEAKLNMEFEKEQAKVMKELQK